MKIKGINGMTIKRIQDEVSQGGRFVEFRYCFSFFIMSFKQPSHVYFLRYNENASLKALPFTLFTFLLGWWGIPFGVVYTLECLFINISGGKDVTAETLNYLHRKTGGHVFEFENNLSFA